MNVELNKASGMMGQNKPVGQDFTSMPIRALPFPERLCPPPMALPQPIQRPVLEGLNAKLDKLLDSISKLTNAISTLIEKVLSPAQPPAAAAPPAPVGTPGAPNSGSPDAGGAAAGGAEAAKPMSMKDKLMQIISNVLDLVLGGGSKLDSTSAKTDSSVKAEGEKKKGGFFGSLFESALDFGKNLFKKKGIETAVQIGSKFF